MHNEQPQAGFSAIDHDVVSRMEALLRRYPGLDDSETAELLAFLRRGRIIDKGMLSSREGMQERLRQFEADHARALGIGPVQYVLIGLAIAAFVYCCTLLAGIGA